MSAKELIREGKLGEARALLVEGVRSAPTDEDARFLLFQVLCFLGEWDKAERHLEILIAQAPRQAFFIYKSLVAAERGRLECERRGLLPGFLSDPPGYTGEFLAARSALISGESGRFQAVIEALEQELPEISGVADGVPFQGCTDLNAGTCWFLEAFVHDRYLWFPFASLREVTLRQPAQLLDLIWLPATVVTRDGLTTDCYLPVLYADTASHPDDEVRLGRLTDWRPLDGGYYRGVGQHLLLLGEEERGLLELRSITFSTTWES